MCYNGVAPSPLVKFDGSKGNKDYKITSNKGVLYRSDSLDDTILASGTLNKTNDREKVKEFYANDIENNTVKLYNGTSEIYVNFMETIQKSCSYALQEDLDYWESKDKATNAGKLFLIDESDFGTQHIFFDDTINTQSNEVDIRNLITGEPIAYQSAIDKYIVRVETHKAILENDYFVKKIEECEMRRTKEITNIESGLAAQMELPVVEEEDDWKKLKQLSASEYLNKTVLPVVYQGLREIDIERPQDPFRVFALFLLRNQGMVKFPERPPTLQEQEAKEENNAVEGEVVNAD